MASATVFLSAASTKFHGCNPQLSLSRSLGFKKSGDSQFSGQFRHVPNEMKSSSLRCWSPESAQTCSINAKATNYVNPNMVEIQSAQELVDALRKASDRLVIVGFYSPACGGCIALQPKIDKLAESNPNAIFLEVNYEDLKKMCNVLHIPVLPFFKFYKGSKGLLCSFSCTASTIKKFKDALAKHSTKSQLGLSGPGKGLDESELQNLISIGEISLNSDSQLPSSIIKKVGIDNYLFIYTVENIPTHMSLREEPVEAEEDVPVLAA